MVHHTVNSIINLVNNIFMKLNFKTTFFMATLAMVTLNAAQAQATGQKSSPAQLVDALHTAFGNNHSRAVHAKGIILEGDFIPDPEAATLTTAFHLQGNNSKITVRFSDFTGIPDIPDNNGAANPRGLAIKFQSPDGKTTDIVAHSFDGFPTETSDQFRELLLAIGASGTSEAKPTALDKFLGTHPVAKRFLTSQKLPASFGTISYFGVNAFEFTNSKDEAHFIRYQFLPEEEKLLTQEQFEKKDRNYLLDEIKSRIAEKPIAFKLYAQIANKGDVIGNPSIAWPADRKKVLLGTIVIKQLAPNTTLEDKALTYKPNNIPDGIKTADPMLDFRSQAYPISVKERQ
jgi:catalase